MRKEPKEFVSGVMKNTHQAIDVRRSKHDMHDIWKLYISGNEGVEIMEEDKEEVVLEGYGLSIAKVTWSKDYEIM